MTEFEKYLKTLGPTTADLYKKRSREIRHDDHESLREFQKSRIFGETIFVEKKVEHCVEAEILFEELKEVLQIKGLTGIRLATFYELYEEHQDHLRRQEIIDKANGIFFDRPRAELYTRFHRLEEGIMRNNSLIMEDDDYSKLTYAGYCAMEYLTGQYDQKADAAEQCLALLGYTDITIRSGKVILLYGELQLEDYRRIARYTINPVEMRPKVFDYICMSPVLKHIEYYSTSIKGFLLMNKQALKKRAYTLGLSMSIEDLQAVQQYYTKEGRDPTLSEIKILDTYWSDHCRHTTFLTELSEISVPEKSPEARALQLYHSLRKTLGYEDKPVSLMSMATIASVALRNDRLVQDLDISEEVNACSMKISVEFEDNLKEDWLLIFKNETHNHPTEIEPYGGASTCLGGAIRDPLSGRAYVFGGMRISGAGDPREDVANTLRNKLPQRYITQKAAEGFSAYGNQVGLPTTYVKEIYHAGYEAKRLEAGFVIAAVPEANVRREAPQAGDVILLVGGNTGRDGIGGAVGSSKTQTKDALAECSTEVQKGNAVEARALQRLFRKESVARLIKRCNDFGAGGISVAVGELADGVQIYLDKLPVKYRGLDGTELALSESQERMAVVIDAHDVEQFIALAYKENVLATEIASVTAEPYMELWWKDHSIARISREFLNSNGAKRHTRVTIAERDMNFEEQEMDDPNTKESVHASMHASSTSPYTINFVPTESFASASVKDANKEETPFTEEELWKITMAKFIELKYASQHALQAQFDSSVGAGTVLMPYGGLKQKSPAEGLAMLVPTTVFALENRYSGESNETRSAHAIKSCKTVALAALSCPIELLVHSPFHGASYAVVNSLAKIVAMGGNIASAKLSFQEYFRKLGQDPAQWGAPCSAMLGALEAQMALGIPAIGGKDSMSGSYENLHVPPTFISFAISTAKLTNVTRVELGSADEYIYLLPHLSRGRDHTCSPNYAQLLAIWNWYLEHIDTVQSAVSIDDSGLLFALLKMCVGNDMGIEGSLGYTLLCSDLLYNSPEDMLAHTLQGSILFSSKEELIFSEDLQAVYIGQSTRKPALSLEISYPNTTHTTPYLVYLHEAEMAYHFSLNDVFSMKDGMSIPTRPTLVPAYYRQEYITNFSELSTLLEKFSMEDHPIPHIAKPLHKQVVVSIPVFPGTNSEDDTAVCFELFGAKTTMPVFLNKTQDNIGNSLVQLAESIRSANIFVMAGGFTLGDQPEGAGKYLACILRHPQIADALFDLLKRDGLILGICNGFQALLKSGWLPYQTPQLQGNHDATLTINNSVTHLSCITQVQVQENSSPWLSLWNAKQELLVPISHGEGRFVASSKILKDLQKDKQIATKYIPKDSNPNGSMRAIEGITSPNGRIFGRMGHAERIRPGILKNIPDYFPEPLYKAFDLKEGNKSRLLEGKFSTSLYYSLAMFKAGLQYFE